MTGSKPQSRFRRFLPYALITLVTMIAVDVVLIAAGAFPPKPNYGDKDLGWRSAPVTGRMTFGQCTEFSTNEVIRYDRNEDGVRTNRRRDDLKADSTSLKIADTGDSQTDLCSSNSDLHAGALQAALRANGMPAEVLTFGSGRYSPLQAYMAFRLMLRPYRPEVLVLNVYTGNDFYDILRLDDRPHFEAVDTGYRIAPPVWFSLDDPAVTYRSRALFALRTMAEATGVRKLYFRISELRRLGGEYGGGLTDVLGYMSDLWKAREPSIGYSDALSAQFLNQQLFFHRFPRSEDESVQRVRALMRLARAENPGLTLMMSPLPSYELVGESPVDSALTRTLQRLPITLAGGRAQEARLYDRLRELALEEGWIFADNLAALQAYSGPERLFNDFDYHLLPVASRLVGQTQARALAEYLASNPK